MRLTIKIENGQIAWYKGDRYRYFVTKTGGRWRKEKFSVNSTSWIKCEQPTKILLEKQT